MAISDSDYEAWLKADSRRRVLLVEAKAYSSGVEVTRYFSDRGFVSTPADTPANVAYDDIVTEVPYFVSRISEVFTGASQSAWGDIYISNENGVRSAWLDDAWDGRAVAIFLGDPSWPKSDFRKILDGMSADIVAPDRGRLALRIRDKTWAFTKALQTNLLGGTTANKDRLKPVCYGEVFNVEPVLVTAATHEYQVHDGAINDITDVRDNGVSVLFTKDLANGKFTLNAAPTQGGRITCDVQGAKTAGAVYITKAADIVSDIIATRSHLTSADLDAASFAAFNVTCPQKVHLYARDSMNIAAAIDLLVTAVGGWWTFDRAGLMVLGRFDAPVGAPALELMADDIVEGGLRIVQRVPPLKSVRLGYQRNYTPQPDGLAGAVTEANAALYSREYQTVTHTNAGVATAYLLAQEPPQVPTQLSDVAEGQTECTRRATLWSVLRYVYEAACFTAPFNVRLGQVIEITHPRYGFAAGKLAVIVGIRSQPSRGLAVLELFA